MPDVTITLKTIDQSSAAVKKVKEEYKSLAPGLEKAAGGVGKFMSANAALIGVLGGVGAAVVATAKFLHSAAKEFEIAAKNSARLEAIVKSTGGAAGLTAQQIEKMSTELEVLNGVDGEVIKSAQAVLLTFTKVRGEAFEKTTQAAIDMTAVLGGQVPATIEALGKAMNDFSGFTMLKKSGVSFSEEQIKQIANFKATNDIVGYQNLILGELALEFGGAQKAMFDAGLASEKVDKSWGDLRESIGERVAPAVREFNESLAGTLDALTEVSERMNTSNKHVEEYNKLTGESVRLGRGRNEDFERFSNELERGALMTEFYTGKFPPLTTELQNTEEAQAALAESSNQFMSVLQSVSSETESYNEKNQELLDKLAELTAEQANTSEWSSKYKELTGEIAATKGEIDALATEHNKASQRIIFDLITQQAAADGFKKISVEALAKIGEEWGVLAEGSSEATSIAISQADAWTEALAEPVQKLTDIIGKYKALKKLSETGIVITAEIAYSVSGGALGGLGGGSASAECFTGDTLVTLGDGSHKPIRDIRKGDAVLSYNTDTNQQLVTIVVETFEHVEHNNGRLLLINNHLRVTEEHALWNGKEWKHARFYDIGDLLMNVDGSYQTITSIAEIPKNEPTYNLHVDHEVHNYFAGGVLVHNAQKWTGGQLSGKEWTLVGDKKGGGFIPGASELISPSGYVIDSATSEKILKMGLVNYKSMAFGSDDGGYTNASPISPVYTPPPSSGGRVRGGGGSSGSSGSTSSQSGAAIDAVVADVQEQTQSAVTSMQMQIEVMASRIEKSQKESRLVLEKIAGILVSENPNAVGKVVGYEISRAS